MSQELILHDAKLMARLDKLGRAAKRAHDRVRNHAAKAVENMVRRAQNDFVASGQDLFCAEVTTSEASATDPSTSALVGEIDDNW